MNKVIPPERIAQKRLERQDLSFYKSQFEHDGVYLNYKYTYDRETHRFHKVMKAGHDKIKALREKLDKLIKECEEEK
jgi:hypothetical protein